MRAVLHELYSNMEERPDAYPNWFIGHVNPSRAGMQRIKNMPKETDNDIINKSNAYRSQVGVNFEHTPRDSVGFIYTTQCFANVRVNLRHDTDLFEDLTEKYSSLFNKDHSILVRYKRTNTTVLITGQDFIDYLRKLLAITPSLMQNAIKNDYN